MLGAPPPPFGRRALLGVVLLMVAAVGNPCTAQLAGGSQLVANQTGHGSQEAELYAPEKGQPVGSIGATTSGPLSHGEISRWEEHSLQPQGEPESRCLQQQPASAHGPTCLGAAPLSAPLETSTKTWDLSIINSATNLEDGWEGKEGETAVDGSALHAKAAHQRALLQTSDHSQAQRNRQHMSAYMTHAQRQSGELARRGPFRMHDPSQLGLLDGIGGGADVAREVTPLTKQHGSMHSLGGWGEDRGDPLKDVVTARVAKVAKPHEGRLARAGVNPFDGQQAEEHKDDGVSDTIEATPGAKEQQTVESGDQIAALIEQRSVSGGVDLGAALLAAKRRLQPEPRPLPRFPDALLAPIIATHAKRARPPPKNGTGSDFRTDEPWARAKRGLAIAETLDDLGPSHLKVAVPALGVDLFVYRVSAVRAKGEWVLRFLSFVQDPAPKIWWGSQGGNSAKATDLQITCHFLGFVKQQSPPAPAPTEHKPRGWSDLLSGWGLGSATKAVSRTQAGARALLEEEEVASTAPERSGSALFAEESLSETGSFEREGAKRALLSARDGSLHLGGSAGGTASMHHARWNENTAEGRVSVGGVWWGGDRQNMERLTRRRGEAPKTTPPEDPGSVPPDSEAVPVTGEFDVAARVRVNYDAIATRSGHVNAAYSMFVECTLPPELGAFLEGMTGDHMVATQLRIRPESGDGSPPPVLDMRLVLDPTTLETGPPAAERFLTGCMGPIFGAVDARPWVEWVEYHREVIGLDHLIVYAHDAAARAALQPYIDEGVLTFRHWQPTAPPDVLEKAHKYYDQTVLNVDCLLRSRHRARWLMFVDLDEYVQISSRFGYSARAMLANFPDHWAALRVKRIRYLVAPQVEEAGLTLVQKYVRHSRKHEHGDKTFMRPEKVVANGVHYVDVLEESEGPLEYAVQPLSLLDARVNHYWRPLHRISQTDKFGSELNDEFEPFDQIESAPESVARLAETVRPRVEHRLADRRRRELEAAIESAAAA